MISGALLYEMRRTFTNAFSHNSSMAVHGSIWASLYEMGGGSATPDTYILILPLYSDCPSSTFAIEPAVVSFLSKVYDTQAVNWRYQNPLARFSNASTSSAPYGSCRSQTRVHCLSPDKYLFLRIYRMLHRQQHFTNPDAKFGPHPGQQ